MDKLNFDEIPESDQLRTILDEEDGTLSWHDAQTGEILGVQDAPPDAATALQIADFLSEKLPHAQARLEGLKAEKQTWLDRISARYDKRIARLEKFVAFLLNNPVYRDVLRRYVESALAGKKQRSVPLGLLTLSLHKKPSSLPVSDKKAALAWARAECPEAIKTETVESVLVSRIPDAVKSTLTKERITETGILFVAEYEDFTIS